MLKSLSSWFRRITGISTPLGGIQWPSLSESPYDVPKFEGIIAITSSANDEFIRFAESNVGAIIYLDAVVDACVATQEQHDVIEREGIEIEKIANAQINEITYPLLNSLGKIVFVKFSLLADHKPYPSFGGTGIIQIPMTGFFMIGASAHSGPSIMFHISEHMAPLEARLHLVNKAKKK